MGIWGHRVGMQFQNEYCDRFPKVLVDEGFFAMRAQDINENPRFVDLYMDYCTR